MTEIVTHCPTCGEALVNAVSGATCPNGDSLLYPKLDERQLRELRVAALPAAVKLRFTRQYWRIEGRYGLWFWNGWGDGYGGGYGGGVRATVDGREACFVRAEVAEAELEGVLEPMDTQTGKESSHVGAEQNTERMD